MTRQESSNTFKTIYHIVRSIPSGKVATYGQIAALVGPGMPARIIGFALHGLPENNDVPWHRVINSMGKISYSSSRNEHDSLQRNLLEGEGVQFSSTGKIDLNRYLWQPGGLNN